MKALKFLELAQRLFDNDPSPESRRTVISRAYYGAFGTALEFLAAMSVPLPKRISEHEKVPDLLESSAITNLMTAGQMLDTLRRQRNDADYDFANTDVEDRNFVEQRLSLYAEVLADYSSAGLTL